MMLTPPDNFFRCGADHKGSGGRLAIVAGSWGYAGAGLLCAHAAIVGGCGYVFWFVPEKIYAVAAGQFLDGVVWPLQDEGQGCFLETHVAEVVKKPSTAMVVGPGLGQTEASAEFLSSLLTQYQAPLVLDADALNLLKDLECLKKRNQTTILTPHPGEAARLLNISISDVQKNREEAVKALSRNSACLVILKGQSTLVCEGDRVWKNEHDSATLATAGSGDILAGLIGALLARQIPAVTACQFAVAWHGAAGQKLAASGPQGVGASSLLGALRDIQKELWLEYSAHQ